MTDLFKGQTLIAYSVDPMIAPKVVMDFAKTNDKVVVLGGSMGATTLNAEAVKSLATLPSLDEPARKAAGPSQCPGNSRRYGCRRTCKPGGTGVLGLRQEGRSRLRRFFAVNIQTGSN